ncbi:hypothetical protein M2323_004589 [Rhodoblastus acidophilus]|uniref:DUF1190 domain-containing protein n=1 Tax=Rhodoblastus acidophilus TaxID=1074 RepID=UPI002224DA53|nr:DUF1190 domain-containing protein [Rhodoblastus acidophilus]MCW2283825.1 hypothetical protein [Rhodoblastus acidophilus]MCW2335637.1 hypothetical protein [Rhodoblastus acidophilus]
MSSPAKACDRMKRARHGPNVIAAGITVGLVAVLVATTAQAAQKKTYATQASCQADVAFTADECRNAFANAQTEIDEAAPRFSKRDECERHFRRCMIAGFQGRVEFAPALKAVEITVVSSSEKTVTPVLQTEAPGIVLSSRTVLRPDNHISAAKRKKNQENWTNWLKARSAPPENPTEVAPAANDINEPSFRNPPEPEKIYPGDSERERRRREEIKNAPLVR